MLDKPRFVKLLSVPMEDEPEQLLTPDDVARWLRVERKWVVEHTTRYEPIIPHVRIGRAVRFRREDVERFISERVSAKPLWSS